MKTPEQHKRDMMGWYYALKEAYFSGMSSVSYADHSVSYQSRADMRQALNELEAELGISSSGSPRVRIGIFKKGL